MWFGNMLQKFVRDSTRSGVRAGFKAAPIVLFALSLFWALPLRAHDDRPIPLRGVNLEQKLGQQVPLELKFRDESGRAVDLKSYFGQRPVILALVYYSCQDICPLVLDGLVRSLRPLSFNIGDQFDVITVSFDPRDTAALAAAKKTAMAGPGRRRVGIFSREMNTPSSGSRNRWAFVTTTKARRIALAMPPALSCLLRKAKSRATFTASNSRRATCASA
jgi:hypothetical protein